MSNPLADQPAFPEEIKEKIEKQFPEGSESWQSRQMGALYGYSLAIERVGELERENKELSEGIDAIASKLTESEELCEQYQRDMENKSNQP